MLKRSAGLTLAATASVAAWTSVALADQGMRAEEPPLLLPLEPMVVPIVDHGEIVGQMALRAMWRAGDEEALAKAENRLPQLRSALLTGASDHAALATVPSRPVDPSALSHRMETQARAVGLSGELLVLEASARPK